VCVFPGSAGLGPRIHSQAQLSNPNACGQFGMVAVSLGRFSPGRRLAFEKLQQLLTLYLGSSGLD